MFSECQPPQLPREFESRQNGVLNRSQFFSPFYGFLYRGRFHLENKLKMPLNSENKRVHQEINADQRHRSVSAHFQLWFWGKNWKLKTSRPNIISCKRSFWFEKIVQDGFHKNAGFHAQKRVCKCQPCSLSGWALDKNLRSRWVYFAVF